MTQGSALRRKTELFRPEEKTPVTAPRAFRNALLRHAQAIPALRLEVAGLAEARLSLAELLDGLEAPAFVAVLAGPRDSLGVALISPGLTGALIEAGTTGRLGPGDPPVRRTTPTDAMLAGRFLDAMLEGAGQELEGAADAVWAAGFRYSSWLDDARPLGLMLEEGSYRLLTLTVSLGGARQGRLMLALPAAGRGRVAPPAPRAAPVADPAATLWEAGFEASVSAAAVRLDAVIARLDLPLARIAALVPGDVIPLPGAALDRIALTALDGKPVAEGRLGQSQNARAIRLSMNVEPPA